ncbi:hypothetical protein Tco_0882976 [Tanacetum coccineum]
MMTEIISTKIDLHYFNAEYNLIESLLNRDILIDSSPKFDYLLEEFSGELAHIDPIPSGIEKANFDLEEKIRLVENLLMIRYDSEGDIRFLEELFNNDSLPLLENESSNLDHFNNLLPSRPPPEPPDVEVCFDFKPDAGVVTNKVVGETLLDTPMVITALIFYPPNPPFIQCSTFCFHFRPIVYFITLREDTAIP